MSRELPEILLLPHPATINRGDLIKSLDKLRNVSEAGVIDRGMFIKYVETNVEYVETNVEFAEKSLDEYIAEIRRFNPNGEELMYVFIGRNIFSISDAKEAIVERDPLPQKRIKLSEVIEEHSASVASDAEAFAAPNESSKGIAIEGDQKELADVDNAIGFTLCNWFEVAAGGIDHESSGMHAVAAEDIDHESSGGMHAVVAGASSMESKELLVFNKAPKVKGGNAEIFKRLGFKVTNCDKSGVELEKNGKCCRIPNNHFLQISKIDGIDSETSMENLTARLRLAYSLSRSKGRAKKYSESQKTFDFINAGIVIEKLPKGIVKLIDINTEEWVEVSRRLPSKMSNIEFKEGGSLKDLVKKLQESKTAPHAASSETSIGLSAGHVKASAATEGDKFDFTLFDELDSTLFDDSAADYLGGNASDSDFATHSAAPKNFVTCDESLSEGGAAVVRDSAGIVDRGDPVSGFVRSPSAKKVSEKFFEVEI